MNSQYRDPIIADLRQVMLVQDVLKQYANVHFVKELTLTLPPGSLAVGWLHENMIQTGRAMAALAIGTWSCFPIKDPAVQGLTLIHNYVQEMDARLVQRWRYPVEWKGKVTEYLGWNVRYIKEGDITRLEQHPMIASMHRVAANNRKYPAKWGPSRLMSWQATPKYAVIAGALAGREVFVECPHYWDWKAVVTKGFQSELSVMSGEWSAAPVPLSDEIAFAGLF